MSKLTDRGTARVYPTIFSLIALYFLIWPLWRAFYPMEITPNEGWNAYHQDAAVYGVLYPDVDALIVNNYPPLSFYLVGWLGYWLGDALYIGRAISTLSILGLGIVIAFTVRRLGGSAIAGMIAGTWFVAVMAGSFNRFVAMNDPQLFAQMVMTIALLWFLSRDKMGASAAPPLLLMVVAGFIKHNIVVIPATVLVWLALRDGRRALPAIALGLMCAAAGLLICVVVYGEVFLPNLLTERRFSFVRSLASIGRLQFILPALITWAFWAWHARQTTVARFTALYIIIGILFYFVQWAGEGVVDNAQFDLVIATAVGLGIAYDRLNEIKLSAVRSVACMRTLIVAILVTRLLATGRIEPALILFDPVYREKFSEHAAIVTSETARVAAIRGDVWCSLKLICRRAGKPFAVDDFSIEQMLATGRITQTGLDELLKRRGITRIVIDKRAETSVLDRDLLHPHPH